MVKIPEASRRAKEYPHQLSGGMKQRAMIAMALSSNPSFLIADEPTTALDVTIQKQILYLVKDIQGKLGTSVLFITHNLGVIAEIAEKVLVMYAGKILEYAPVNELFYQPQHPYTSGLLKSLPRLDAPQGTELNTIPGRVPPLSALPQGCVFHPRCSLAEKKCREEEPPLFKLSENHLSRCWKSDQIEKQDSKPKITAFLVGNQKKFSDEYLLKVKNLTKHFQVKSNMFSKERYVRAVEKTSLSLQKVKF